ncbi:hypothetical protein KC573_00625 [candidate division WWE3 bacterium]|uniref:DUF885 domain-containing protein n=1 Tax=candidate division WWE3 bacterium TaxID=2053526 RepID=A0A955LVK5_UNCKA|nr:hypothetical protein [candidate division WWE3 bacterium]
MILNTNDPGQQFVRLALSINTYMPGYVSEYWGDKELKTEIENNPVPLEELINAIDEFRVCTEVDTDQLRKEYLLAHADAFEIIARELLGETIPFEKFLPTTTGIPHEPINEENIAQLKDLINDIAVEKGCKPYELYIAQIVKPSDIIPHITSNIRKIQPTIETAIQTQTPGSFTINTVKEAPWGAFNHHMAPYTSVIEVNETLKVDELDLLYLLIHEALGGHHTELSLKDHLYTEEKRFEHSLVCVFSPQSFISEGIAESACEIFDVISSKNETETLFLYFNQLYNMMQYNAVFKIHQEKWTQEQVRSYFEQGDFFEENDIDATVRFVFDPIWGRYGAWYYAAKRLVLKKYNMAEDKKLFLTRLYTQPVIAKSL